MDSPEGFPPPEQNTSRCHFLDLWAPESSPSSGRPARWNGTAVAANPRPVPTWFPSLRTSENRCLDLCCRRIYLVAACVNESATRLRGSTKDGEAIFVTSAGHLRCGQHRLQARGGPHRPDLERTSGGSLLPLPAADLLCRLFGCEGTAQDCGADAHEPLLCLLPCPHQLQAVAAPGDEDHVPWDVQVRATYAGPALGAFAAGADAAAIQLPQDDRGDSATQELRRLLGLERTN